MPVDYEYFFSIANFHFKAVSGEKALKSLVFEKKKSTNVLKNIPKILIECQRQLTMFLDGKLNKFELDLEPDGTDFQKRVWKKLLEIPYGSTMTYAELAHKLGDPKVIRAAATANAKNPITIIIPCHRVIGANGELTGYAWGLHIKKHLLDIENRVANGVLTLF